MSKIPKGIFELMAEVAETRHTGGDLELARRSKPTLDSFFTELQKHVGELEEINDSIEDAFSDSRYVHATFDVEGQEGFFPFIHHHVSKELTTLIDSYLAMAQKYEVYVQGRLNDRAPHREGIDIPFSMPESEAAGAAIELVGEIMKTYVHAKTLLPHMAKNIHAAFSGFDKHLHKRFVKTDEDEDENKMRSLAQMLHEDDQMSNGVRYVKIPLFNGSPVLTEVLLQLSENIPKYREYNIKAKGRKSKKERTVSAFAIDETAEKLAGLADAKMLSYLEKPARFSALIGSVLEKFYTIVGELEPKHQAIMNMPHAKVLYSDPSAVRRVLKDNGKGTERHIASIKRADLDTVVQNKDDLLPNSTREKDFFAAREKLLKSLYDGLKALSKIGDISDRVDEAKRIVRDAVDAKDEMDQLIISEKARMLRRDKTIDNEYYVGRQHGHGQFKFERKPAPDVKLDDVIGATFDQAKSHLSEIIETGATPRLMRLSAPGGKVKSNILLIGPYGCGKSELARAICADKRVIGASVSVANTLTAYMHESVNNVKRVYDQAVELFAEGRGLKPVALVLDEFNGWFASGGRGTYTDTDMQQIENVFLEVLDGMEDYTGIITVAMTNKPKEVPAGIMRRFRYVDVVGQLTREERERILKLFLEKRLPISSDVPNLYHEWAEKLEDAPGDVVRKVIDEVHFSVIPQFIRTHPQEAKRIERVLYQREARAGALAEKDIEYIKGRLEKYGFEIKPEQVTIAVDEILRKPVIQQQINAAREVYSDAQAILEEIANPLGFGFKPRSNLFEVNR